ncbi:MAG TPA: ParB/RepB/Spo0J family partition protein [Terriglobales bacterium]|jgi:ParB family chromosome partitioning protein
MTTVGNLAGKLGESSGGDKAAQEKSEKRKALGRGLESLLPSGPRVVAGTAVAGATSATAPVPLAAPAVAGGAAFGSAPMESTRTGVSAPHIPGAPHSSAEGVVPEIQAQAARRPGDEVREIPLDQIDQNPYQTRRFFNEEMLEELADSIKANGVLQPIVVRPHEGRFVLVIGERRSKASKLAGKLTIPAIVRRVSDQQAAEMTVVENLQRQDLNCLEQAAAFAKLSMNFGLTQEQIGQRVGLARESVSNYMRLLKLPGTVMQYLQTGELGFSEARVLLQFDNEPQTITRLADEAVKKHLSVEGVRELCTQEWVIKEPKEPKLGNARWVDPNVRAIQRKLEETLGVRVRIADRHGKGKIVIEYGTLEDFDRVIDMLGKQ